MNNRTKKQGGRPAQRGFRYQREYIALKSLEMISKGDFLAVHCDYEEDCLIINKSKHSFFFQIKSKDEGGGGYTISKICSKKKGKSIIDKMFEVYLSNSTTSSKFYFVSNKDAEGDLLELKSLKSKSKLNKSESRKLQAIYDNISKKTKPQESIKFKDFLNKLVIKTNEPDLTEIEIRTKSIIRSLVSEQYGNILSDRDIDITYNNILDLIDRKSSKSLFPLLKDYEIKEEEILNLISFSPFRKLILLNYSKKEINTLDHTQLEIKLQKGEFDDLFIDYAKKLRFASNLELRKFKRLPSISKIYEGMVSQVERICVESFQKFKLNRYKDNMELYDDIRNRFKELISKHKSHLDLSEDFLLGVMFDITSRCGMRWEVVDEKHK